MGHRRPVITVPENEISLVLTAFHIGTLLNALLFILNMLPIPMLDGGWIVFGLVEMVTRRELPERFLMAAQAVGMVLVFSIMAVAIFNDILRQFA